MLRSPDPPVIAVTQIPLATRLDPLAAAPADRTPGRDDRLNLAPSGIERPVVTTALPTAPARFVVGRMFITTVSRRGLQGTVARREFLRADAPGSRHR